MNRIFIIYISTVILTTAAIYYAGAQERSVFREKIVQYLEKTSAGSDPVTQEDSGSDVYLPPDQDKETFFKRGDWSEYVSDPQYNQNRSPFRNGNIYSDDTININSSGSVKLNLNYGKSYYTDSKYKQYDGDQPRSRVIDSGFWPEQTILLHMDGTIGDRITVFIDHDSRREENHYVMNYRAVSDDEVIREINAGEIDIKFNHSKYAVYDNTEAKALGVDFTVKKGDFSLKAFGSVARGETAVEYFKGNSSPGITRISEYQYVRAAYYQLEPFIRYDGVTGMPSGVPAYSLVTITSTPSSPAAYTPVPVNISPAGFELYIDDQNQYNNNNAIQLTAIDNGYYTKMVNGTDYSINYSTGVIHFLKDFPESSRIFAVYNRSGGTLDPCALSPGDPKHPGGTFTGKIFVFIKYGYSINEDIVTKNLTLDAGETDRNFDGKVNLDIYEIRSVYYLGAKNLLASGFSLSFFEENQIMQKDDIALLSRYNPGLTDGVISFYTREPYRTLLSADSASKIYNETKIANAYLSSRYQITSEFNVEARTFKLKHDNIIDKSVKIKINEKDIPESLYSVNYAFGSIVFTDANNPVISSDTRIEIKYEYLPFGSKNENFIGGMRADYDVSKSLRIGGSLMVSKDGQSEIVPDIGKVSEQTLLFEGDASLKLSQARLADLYNIFAERKKKSIPAEFSAYAEYAKSYKDVNTFGKALLDNMETSDEIVSVSLSEKDWILSSMPASYTQSDRGILNYLFYRNPDSPDTLKGIGYTPHVVAYPVKPGPYNVAMGHVDNSIVEQEYQKSLVFDFGSSGTVVSAVTNKLSDSAIDFSGMQYIEVWVKYEGTVPVNLMLDLGSVNEDSDGDGSLDSEDRNRNGYIDSEPSSGYSEDRGYTFNPSSGTATKVGSGPGLGSSTLGDGILNSEDLNSNGILDTLENVYTVTLGSISPAGGTWQQVRFYMNWSTLTPAEIQNLQQTKSIRLYLTKGVGTSGKLFIDSLKVVSSRWKNPELNGIAIVDPNVMKVTLVNSINDSDYRNDSFLVKQKGTYEMLYGDDSTDDIKSESETALQIEYGIIPLLSNISIERKFSKEIDVRFYKTLNIWANVRNIISSNTIGFIVGSSDNDYIEYRVSPPSGMIWSDIKLKLSDDSNGNVEKYLVNGNPDLKRIKYIKTVIHGDGSTSGKIWLNEIYVSEPEKLQGDAHWYEFELKTLKPLFKTDSGVPILSDMNLRYIYKGHSSQFSAVNKTSSDIKENYHELFSSAKILPNWNASVDYVNETSRTDSLNGDVPDAKKGAAERDFVNFNTSFNSTEDMIPSINIAYSYDKNENSKELVTDIDKYYSEDTVSVVHTPVIVYRQELANFLFGKVSLRMMLDMAFSHSKVNRDSMVVSDPVLSTFVALNESEKKQESDGKIELDYSNSLFYLRPRVNSGSSEIVQLEGPDRYDATGVNGPVKGNFYLPFSKSDNLKYLERNNGTGLVFGIKFLKYFLPEYSMGIDYKENGFKDYKDTQAVVQGFNRSKNSMSNLMTDIKVPVQLNKADIFKKVKHLQFNYNRSIYFDEKDVPFEGEGSDFFSEKYGISNIISGLSSPVYNLFNQYPGFYFKGRGNAGEGRDLIYRTFNNDYGIRDISSLNEYNNSIKLMDKFTADLSVDAGLFTVSSSGGLSQVCERSNVYGIPNQAMVADAGVNFEFDLMKLFSFSFFRSNGEGLSYHASLLDIGLNFTDSMLITYNINEKKITPSVGIVFKWDRSSLAFKYEFDYREKKNKEYISTDLQEGDSDYIYLQNMEGNNKFSEKDFGHKFSTLYETDVAWLYYFFSNFYKLTGIPIFSAEYKMEINRYDYFKTVSPEPYDLQMIKSDLKLDLHKNIQGGFSGNMALEKFRNRENNGVSREVLSYQISASISLIF